MEYAIHITHPRQLRYLRARHTRVYFGNEFCERLIPTRDEIEETLMFTRKKGLKLSFLTPYATNRGIQALFPLFDMASVADCCDEVVVNDWGVLRILNRCYQKFEPVLGRLLTKQKRGPNLKELLKRTPRTFSRRDSDDSGASWFIVQKKLPLALDSYYKSSGVATVPEIHHFLASQGIRRLELDNVEQGFYCDFPHGKLSASLYLPYVYISTSLFCPSAGCDSKKYPALKIKPCTMQCRKYIFELRNRSMHKVIYLKGNTQFYKNNRLHMRRWRQEGVDRIVYEPEIPV